MNYSLVNGKDGTSAGIHFTDTDGVDFSHKVKEDNIEDCLTKLLTDLCKELEKTYNDEEKNCQNNDKNDQYIGTLENDLDCAYDYIAQLEDQVAKCNSQIEKYQDRIRKLSNCITLNKNAYEESFRTIEDLLK